MQHLTKNLLILKKKIKMELIHVQQVPYDILKEERIDVLMLACYGKNENNTLISSFLVPAQRKIIFLFCDEEIQDEKFSEFEVLKFSTKASKDEIYKALNHFCQSHYDKNIKIVVDYTFMPKRVLGCIVSFLSLNDFFCQQLTVYFCYSNPPNINGPSLNTTSLEPILVYDNYKFNQRPIALIIEINDATTINLIEELQETFYPTTIYLFIPLEINTDALVKRFKNKITIQQILYTPTELEEIDNQLRHLCHKLRLEHRVVVVPLGTKTFSLVSFLINSRFPDVEVWQYGTCFGEKILDTGEKYIYKAILAEDYLE